MAFFAPSRPSQPISLYKNAIVRRINCEGPRCCLYRVFLYSELNKFNTWDWMFHMDMNLQMYINSFLAVHPQCSDVGAFCNCECDTRPEAGLPSMCSVLQLMVETQQE